MTIFFAVWGVCFLFNQLFWFSPSNREEIFGGGISLFLTLSFFIFVLSPFGAFIITLKEIVGVDNGRSLEMPQTLKNIFGLL